jgi:hypothetical protein
LQFGPGGIGVKTQRSALSRRPVDALDQGQESRAPGQGWGQRGVSMSDSRQEISEEIRKREKMMVDRMAAYHRSMEKYASNGDLDDQEDANRSINVWLKLKDEVTKLKKYLSELE